MSVLVQDHTDNCWSGLEICLSDKIEEIMSMNKHDTFLEEMFIEIFEKQ
jgi:hypothetical protein